MLSYCSNVIFALVTKMFFLANSSLFVLNTGRLTHGLAALNAHTMKSNV